MFRPLNNRILVLPDKQEEKIVSGIIVAQKNQEKPSSGTVVVATKDFSVGDKVLFSKFGYDEVELDGVLHNVVSADCILGIF